MTNVEKLWQIWGTKNLEASSFALFKHSGRVTYATIHHGLMVQSGASSCAKHGGAYFSAVYGSIKDMMAALGPYDHLKC